MPGKAFFPDDPTGKSTVATVQSTFTEPPPSSGRRCHGKGGGCPRRRREVSGIMSLTPRWVAVGLILLAGPLLAQHLPEEQKPAVHVPKTAQSRQDLDRLEALRLYALGTLHERNNRLVEAVKAYEAAQRLDPDTSAIPRLSQLYLALDRTEDGLSACRRTLELVPGDYRTGYLLARQLRGLERFKEAIAVLKKTVRAKALKERPDQAAQIWFDLAMLQEKMGDLAGAEKSLLEVAGLFDNSAAMIASGHLSREEVTAQSAETYERLGKVCLKAKAIDRAVRAFEQAQKKDSLRTPRLAYNLARVLFDQGKPARRWPSWRSTCKPSRKAWKVTR